MVYHSDPQILTLEVGLVGCKAAIVSISGVISDVEFSKIDLIYPYTGGVELDPEALWSTILRTMTVIASRSQLAYGQFSGICCSVSIDGMIPVDINGNALRNASIWNDWRIKKDRFSVFKGWKSSADMGLQMIKRRAKINVDENQPGLLEPAIQMLLFRELYPDIYRTTHKFVSILDFINYKLAGRFVSTPDSCLKDWIMDTRNPIFEAFSQDLLRDRGIDENKMNEVVPNSAVIGELQQNLAEQTRLPLGMKVIAGGMAGVTSIVGAGAVDDFQPFFYLGSSSWIEVHLPAGKWRSDRSIHLDPSAIPGRQILSSIQLAATANLNYLRDRLFFPVDELNEILPPDDTFQIMDRMASKAPPGSNGLIYIPLIKGNIGSSKRDQNGAILYNLTLDNTR
jgi:xylulokinase